MVGAVPVCPPERPRSGVSIHKRYIHIRKRGVSIHKEYVPHPQKRHLHALKCLCIAHDAHPLSMDAPSWGDTGGHTGAAPTNLHQIPLPVIISCFCPSASTSPTTLGHGAIGEMVEAVPVCPPERPRSGVSIRKRHVPHPQRSRFHS